MDFVLELAADCSRCAGLCCVALPFGRSSDFPVDKAAGDPCGHLGRDFRCGIHDRLREEGYRGCGVFDCFGAGQQVTQVTFGGKDWRSSEETGAQMFAVFAVMRQLHELLWHLDAALGLPTSAPLSAALESAVDDTVAVTRADAAALASYDVETHRRTVNPLLRQASQLARQAALGPTLDAADLIGRDLRDTALVGASLRGALLTGADLRRADLTLADVTGADLRGADVSGAHLTHTLFLTQAQVDAARGNGAAELPARLARPRWWPTAESS
jgi:uncharacterized protein YjbI with pentapeptide repeats